MTFNSKLSPYIVGLIEQKHLLGYRFTYGEAALLRFDKFICEKFPDAVTITNEIGSSWATQLPDEKVISTAKRVAPIRELAKYMNRIGKASYIIPIELVKHPSGRYVPHIFTDFELGAFFQATDRVRTVATQNPFVEYEIPVIFRMIYACGLRPQEARRLKLSDVDLQTGELRIAETKRHKERVLVLPDDMLSLCRSYYSVLQSADLGFQPELFFPIGNEPNYCVNWLRDWFWRCFSAAGLNETYTGSHPRPYDFRHTFATKRLYLWMQSGLDVESKLPYLSAYMGHAHLSQTAYYIHLVPEILPYFSDKNLERFEDLLPEVDYES